MAGKRIFAFAVFVLVALAFALSARGGAEAQTFKVYNGFTLSSLTPGDSTGTLATVFAIASPDFNYEDASLTTINPVDVYSANGLEAPIGAKVGTLASSVMIGLLGGTCNTSNSPLFQLYNSSVDIAVEDPITNMGWILKDVGVPIPDTDTDGLPDYMEKYPYFLNVLYDPDGPASGSALPLQPRARLAGTTNVANKNILIQVLIWNPGQLTGAGGSYVLMDAAKGGPTTSVLNDPVGEIPVSGAIGDFCTPLTSTTTLVGVTLDRTETAWVNDGCPAKDDPEGDDVGEETWCGLNAVDNDGDTNVNDGCPALGPVENPACVNSTDDDPVDDPNDRVNDGCPIKGSFADCDSNTDGDCDDTGEAALCQEATTGIDDDGDTRVNDGCPINGSLVEDPSCANAVNDDADSEAGYTRQSNPPANTGLLNTGTHITYHYAQSERNADGDAYETDFDACKFTADPSNQEPRAKTCTAGSDPGDMDCDMIGVSCDPNDAVQQLDIDNDGYSNTQDNCPFVQNGCKTSACGIPFNLAWDNQDDRDSGIVDTDLGPKADAIGDSCDDSDDDGNEDGGAAGDCNDGIDNGGGDNIDANDPDCTASMDKADWPATTTSPLDGTYHHSMPWDAECVGQTDTDLDGYCDVLEGALGSSATDGPDANCGDALDDVDDDPLVNDGCPFKFPIAESGAQCLNAIDDDIEGEDGCDPGTCNDGIDNGPNCNGTPPQGDGADLADTGDCVTGAVNDGCPLIGVPENKIIDSNITATEAALCLNSSSDDTPTPDAAEQTAGVKVNDGCPTVVAAETAGAQCANSLDDDGDGFVNDGCVRVGTFDDCDTDGDGNCTDSFALPTQTAAQSCTDGIDNDNDGSVDAADTACNTWTGDPDFDGWADNLATGFGAEISPGHAGNETYTEDDAQAAGSYTYTLATGAIQVGTAGGECWIVSPGDEDFATGGTPDQELEAQIFCDNAAVGLRAQADLTDPAQADPDTDPDIIWWNIGNIPDTSRPTGRDNCPSKWNPAQTNTDRAYLATADFPVGDAEYNLLNVTHCDNALDDDGDGYVNDGCPAVGNPEDPAAGECNDALDENTQVPNDEGDPAPDKVNDGCPAVADGDLCDPDDDADGYNDTVETYLPTDPLDRCANWQGTPTATRSDTWGLDQNMDRAITAPGDINRYSGKIATQVKTNPPNNWIYSRMDLNGDGVITAPGDINRYSGKIAHTCTP